MLQGEHSAIISTFIKLPFVIEIFVLSIFEWQYYTGYTVISYKCFSEDPLPELLKSLHSTEENGHQRLE